MLGVECIRICLFDDLSILKADTIFIGFSGSHVRDDAGPDSFVTGVQIKSTMLPPIAVTNHTDFFGIGRPDREASPCNVSIVDEMCSKPFIGCTVHAMPFCDNVSMSF